VAPKPAKNSLRKEPRMSFPLKFDINIHTIFMVSNTGQINEMSQESQLKFDGKFFCGETNYAGEYKETVGGISGAWMFIKPEALLFNLDKKEFSTRHKKIADKLNLAVIKMLDCCVIAERPLM
jgi:hypothetical protein